MGLKIKSIARLPMDVDREFYVYLLDYGWEEPFSKMMMANFDRLAKFAADNDAVIIAGFDGEEFSNEVLTYHQVNTEDSDKILPAIMITNTHPKTLSESNQFPRDSRYRWLVERRYGEVVPERMLLIPIREICNNESEFAAAIESIVQDIKSKRELRKFSVLRTLDLGPSNAIIVKPSFFGFGIDLRELLGSAAKSYKIKRKR